MIPAVAIVIALVVPCHWLGSLLKGGRSFNPTDVILFKMSYCLRLILKSLFIDFVIFYD